MILIQIRRIGVLIVMTVRPDVVANTVNVMQMGENYIKAVIIGKIIQAGSLPVVVDFPGGQHQIFAEIAVFAAHTAGKAPIAHIFDDFLL